MWYDFALLIRMSARHVKNYYINLVLLPNIFYTKLEKDFLLLCIYLLIIELINFATIFSF